MCLECGFYKGRMVIDVAAKKKARDERLQAKKDMIDAQQGFGQEVAEEAPATEEASVEAPAEKVEEAKEEK